MSDVDPEVLIVGAGPVGLSLAIELASRGVACRVVERQPAIGMAPRAKTTNVRTRTLLRRWGLADALAAASPFGVDYPSDVAFVTRLGGHLLCRIPNASNCAPDRHPSYPEHAQWIPQYKLEQVLRQHLETLAPARLSLSTELVSAEQSDGEVSATVRNLGSGGESAIRCRYLVGADGARSAVRKLLGIPLSGTYGLSRNYNIVFHAPGLAERHPHGPATMYWQLNADAPGLIGPMDRDDVWFFMPTRLAEGSTLDDAAAENMIRQSTGIDLPYRVLSRDAWTASRLIADRYRVGRVFLAGDACHQHPPFGGFGMNMGIGDAVDLGWKMAARLAGWGGPSLLDAYEAERRPVHETVMDEAVANHALLANDLLSDGLNADDETGRRRRAEAGATIAAAKRREFHTLGTVLGTCYGGSPIVAKETVPAVSQRGETYLPENRPGCLAPHLWLADGRSLYDLFGLGFALVVGAGIGASRVAAVEREAATAGIPLSVIDLTREPASDHYACRLTLIRPDQHVAWTGELWPIGMFDTATGSPKPMRSQGLF